MAQIVITEDQLTSLKEEIKKELMEQNLVSREIVIKKDSLWDELKMMAVEELDYLNTYDRYQVVNALSAILRHSFQIGYIRNLSRKYEKDAKAFTKTILSSMKEQSKREVS